MFIGFSSFFGQTDNYFSKENTLKYANYLFNNFEYGLAMNEYSVLLDDYDFVLKKYLISCKKSENYPLGISTFKSLNQVDNQKDVLDEYFKLLYLNRSFDDLKKELAISDSKIAKSLKVKNRRLRSHKKNISGGSSSKKQSKIKKLNKYNVMPIDVVSNFRMIFIALPAK